MAVVVAPEGVVKEVKPANRSFTLHELYEYTQCDTVGIRRLARGRWLVCDDNGKMKQLPLNPAATILYNEGRQGPMDPVVGTVVIAEPWEIE